MVCVSGLMGLQAAAPFLLIVGGLVLAFGIVAYYRIESVPIGPNRALIWFGAGFLLLGLLAWAAPYIVLFLSARPA